MAKIWSSDLTTRTGDREIGVRVFAESDNDARTVEVFAAVHSDEGEANVWLHFDYQSGTLKITPPGTDPFLVCVVACLGAFLGEELTNCFIKHGHDWNEFIYCLEEHGIRIVGKISGCLATCSGHF